MVNNNHDHEQQFQQGIEKGINKITSELDLDKILGSLADGKIKQHLKRAISVNSPQQLIAEEKKSLLQTQDLGSYLRDIDINGVDQNLLTHTYSNFHNLIPVDLHPTFHKGNDTYFLIKRKLTWIEHLLLANYLGMQLACFKNDNEKTAGQQIAFADTTVESVWLGGFKNTSNIWMWVDGTQMQTDSYIVIPWNRREPNNSGGQEKFVQMYKNGKFNDLSNSTKLYALYQKKNIQEGFTGGYGKSNDGNLTSWALMLGLHTIKNPAKLNECENSDGTVNNKLFAETYLPQSKAKIENIVERYKRELKTYTNIIDSVKSSVSVLNIKHKQLDNLKRKNNIYKQNSFIDNKKNDYVETDIELYKKIYYFVFALYYFALIIALIISKFFKNKLYKNKKILILLILYIILPFILKYILNFFYETFINFLEKNNLRDDIISYTDIVNDYNSDTPSFHLNV